MNKQSLNVTFYRNFFKYISYKCLMISTPNYSVIVENQMESRYLQAHYTGCNNTITGHQKPTFHLINWLVSFKRLKSFAQALISLIASTTRKRISVGWLMISGSWILTHRENGEHFSLNTRLFQSEPQADLWTKPLSPSLLQSCVRDQRFITGLMNMSRGHHNKRVITPLWSH